MRLDFARQRVLAVVAHPDDAELLCAGTLARAKSDGAAIGVCVLCQGDRGQPPTPIADLAGVRRREMQAAARRLGAELLLGEQADGTLMDDAAAREHVVELLRRFAPTLLLAHAPDDYHADHRAASALCEAASWMCASRGLVTTSPPLERPPEVWWMDTLGMHSFEPGFYVDVSAQADLKEQLLACHVSQLQRAGDAAFVPLLDQLRAQMHARGRQSGVIAAEAFRVHHAFGRSRAW